jgi:hypothetical protein
MMQGFIKVSSRSSRYIDTLKASSTNLNQYVEHNVHCMNGKKNIKDHVNFKAILSSAFVHPVTYYKNGSKTLGSWYDDDHIQKLLSDKIPFYSSYYMKNYFKTYVEDTVSFIAKIKTFNHKIDDITFDRYQKFMYLIKKHNGKKLVPPLDVDVVWHAQMMDNESYVNNTIEYFGRIIDHDDSMTKTHLVSQRELTEELWHSEFVMPYLLLSNSSVYDSKRSIIATCGEGSCVNYYRENSDCDNSSGRDSSCCSCNCCNC